MRELSGEGCIIATYTETFCSYKRPKPIRGDEIFIEKSISNRTYSKLLSEHLSERELTAS